MNSIHIPDFLFKLLKRKAEKDNRTIRKTLELMLEDLLHEEKISA